MQSQSHWVLNENTPVGWEQAELLAMSLTNR